MATKQDNMTPMMRQFHDLKKKHPDAVLLFRCGDFYETYEQDAKVVSEVLGITLTKRTGSPKGEGYMAGFPYHALDTYLPKLVRAGKRVAICDMLEPPKKLVRRGSDELTTTATNNRNNNPQTTNTTMKLSINHTKNESANVQNAQVNNVVVAAGSKPMTAEQYKEAPIRDAEAEEIKDEQPTPKKKTIKRKATKAAKAAKAVKESKPTTTNALSGLPEVQFSTYKTKRGDTAPQIIGFAGEDDTRWQAHKVAGHKYVSASYRRDINGEKVYILMFGVRYMDVAKALCGAYNTNDISAWKRAEDACMAIYEQAQRDGKARWEEKKAQWAEKKAEKAAQKAADEQAKKCYSKEDVAAMLADVLAGKDVPEEIKRLLAA